MTPVALAILGVLAFLFLFMQGGEGALIIGAFVTLGVGGYVFFKMFSK